MKSTGHPGEGFTESERLLFAQCSSTYLRFWSYANVYRNQGDGIPRGGDGKECCDLLVVFGKTIIIFSDKSCRFPNTGNPQIDWERWKRKAVEASKRQLLAAERWLREAPERLFLDRKCTIPFPLKLPAASEAKIYRCVVASGATTRIREQYKGVSASLVQLMKPPSHWSHGYAPPFGVEAIDEKGRVFHVFDEITLPLLLRELDTLPDLIEYLESKESLIKSGSLSVVMGEEDLIGIFLGIRAGIGGIVAPPGHQVMISEGIYADIISRPQYVDYRKANEESYLWDGVINYHVGCTLSGNLLPGSPQSVASNEAIIRYLAAEPRLSRRLLARAFLDLYESAPRDQITYRRIKGYSNTIFVFQINPFNPADDAEADRKDRQDRLLAYCLLTQWRLRTTVPVVGICVAGSAPGRDGFEILAIERGEPWTDETYEEFRPFAQAYEEDLTLRGSSTLRSGPTVAWTPAESAKKGSNRRVDTRKRRRAQRRAQRKRKRGS